MSELWSGTFTFLLTDIEGSTRIWENAPGDMAGALARHDEILATLAGDHGGRIVRSRGEGDSAFVVFESPSQALECAGNLQRSFAREPWPPAARVRVRMALHTGPAEVRDEDFYGPAINRAARLRSVAHGGQLIVSKSVYDEVAESLPAGVWLIDLGLHRLKDLARPERVWQVAHSELPADFPPLRSLDARGHNLPVQLTSFVGRELELAAVRKRLETSPLLTLTGPGGIGKTRLAIQAAAEIVDEFPDGVWLVELSSLQDEALVPLLTASVLGVREEAGREITETLGDYLRTREALLVLDNCEHLIDASAKLVASLLGSCEHLRVLATSREPLRVYGEAVSIVPTLGVPSAEAAHVEETSSTDAVRLFIDRVCLVDEDFALTHDTAAIAAQICRRLEGVPLAIELAAALAGTLSIDEIYTKLQDRLGSLAEGPRTAPLRQQTLRAAIDWSHDLLTPTERTVFARLAVFAGGFTIGAAEEICSDDDIGASDIGGFVQRLGDRSLLVAREDAAGTRYRMLDTIREYAHEELERSGTANAIRHRHLVWCRRVAEELAQRMFAPGREDAIAQLDTEHDNIRAALTWGAGTDDRRLAAELVTAMSYYWIIRGHHGEGRRWLAELLPAFPADDPLRPRVLYGAGQLALAQGDREASVKLLDECVDLAGRSGDTQSLGVALNLLAGVALQEGRIEDAKAKASEALELLRPIGVDQFVAQCLNLLGVASSFERDIPSARRFYEEALVIARRLGAHENTSRLLMNLGNIALHEEGENKRARVLYTEAVDLAKTIGDVQTASGALTNLGQLARIEGDLDASVDLFEESLQIKRQIGDARGIGIALHGLAEVRRLQGRIGDARTALIESIELMREIGFAQGMLQGLESMVSVCVDEGEPVMAARLAAIVEAARTSLGMPRMPSDEAEFERCLDAVRAKGQFDETWAEGSALSLEEGIELVAPSGGPGA